MDWLQSDQFCLSQFCGRKMDSLEHVQGCTLDRSDVLLKSLDLCGQRLDACLVRRARTEEMIKDIEEMVSKI